MVLELVIMWSNGSFVPLNDLFMEILTELVKTITPHYNKSRTNTHKFLVQGPKFDWAKVQRLPLNLTVGENGHLNRGNLFQWKKFHYTSRKNYLRDKAKSVVQRRFAQWKKKIRRATLVNFVRRRSSSRNKMFVMQSQ